jgi:hypothetical protein
MEVFIITNIFEQTIMTLSISVDVLCCPLQLKLQLLLFGLLTRVQKFPDWPPGARTANGKLSATRCSCIAIL